MLDPGRLRGQNGTRMKVERIELWHVSVPLPAPFHPAWIPGFRQSENRFTLIRVRTHGGLEGWSAAPEIGQIGRAHV